MDNQIIFPLYSDVVFGGAFRIKGVTTKLNVPDAYRIDLFIRSSKTWVRSTVSASNGEYQFNNIKYFSNDYYLILFDKGNNPLNAAIADLVTPEPMP